LKEEEEEEKKEKLENQVAKQLGPKHLR